MTDWVAGVADTVNGPSTSVAASKVTFPQFALNDCSTVKVIVSV
jgi:hypothetical protein